MYAQKAYRSRAKPKSRYSKYPAKRKPLYPSKILNKGKFAASPDIVCFMPKETQNIFPPRYRTKLTAQFFGFTNTGMGSGDYAWQFKLNSPRVPLNFTNTGLTLNNITASTYQPAGMSTIFNTAIYNFGRVYASSIELDVIPQSVQDSVLATITPSGSTAPNTVAEALTQPYTKQAGFSSGRQTTAKGNTLKNYFTVAKLLGVSHQAIQDDISGATFFQNAIDPDIVFTWNVNIETGDNSALNNSLEVRVRIVYYVEFWSNIGGGQPIT